MNTEKVGYEAELKGVPHPDWTFIFDTVPANVGSRIREARGQMSQKTLAEQIHVHVNTIGKFERGETVPDATDLWNIALSTHTNAAWLLCGNKYEKSASGLERSDKDGLVLVKGYGLKASTGNGQAVDDEQSVGQFAFKRTWIRRKGLNPNNLSVVTAKGDSMEPTVRDGDILLVDQMVDRISTDGIYLIERENDLYCKRLQRSFDGGVTIMSDNPRYSPQQLSPESANSLHITGRVVWVGGER